MDLYYSHSKDSSSILKPEEINTDYLVKTTVCGCCGSKSFKKLVPLYKEPPINYIKCSKCGGVTYDRIYSQAGLDEMYSREDLYEDYEEYGNSKITFYGSERIVKHIMKHIHLPNKTLKVISILDFGGGDGEISYTLAQSLLKEHKCCDVEIVVVDYNESLHTSTNEHIHISRLFPLEAVTEKQFNIVIASAVLEHLPNPGEYMRMLFDRTKKGGYVYFRTPYVFPIYKTLRRIGVNYYTGFPGHIWDLGQYWWDHAADSIGYPKGKIKLVRSCPAIVEKSLKVEFLNSLAAYIMKAVWYIFPKWQYVGGWETIYRKI